MSKRILIIACLLFLAVANPAAAFSVPGSPTGLVSDFANLLEPSQKQDLETKLESFKAETSNEIAVVIIDSLEGDTIEDAAVRLFNAWGIGGEKNDNGILLLVAIGDRQMRIETGYGLEGAVPDATAYQIISKTLQPAFRQEDYYGGLNKATDQIIAATRGEYTAEAVSSNWLSNLNPDSLIWFFIFIFYALSSLWRWLAKSKGWWQGGVIGAVIGLVVALIFFSSLWPIMMLVVGGLGLLADFLVSRVLPAPKPRRPGSNNFWFFGGPRGGTGGHGGFGGFGGGRSGGGGASGSW